VAEELNSAEHETSGAMDFAARVLKPDMRRFWTVAVLGMIAYLAPMVGSFAYKYSSSHDGPFDGSIPILYWLGGMAVFTMMFLVVPLALCWLRDRRVTWSVSDRGFVLEKAGTSRFVEWAEIISLRIISGTAFMRLRTEPFRERLDWIGPADVAWLKAFVAERLDARRCRACGYDLRATPERCPECGRAPGD
jgi:hypothetical protein